MKFTYDELQQMQREASIKEGNLTFDDSTLDIEFLTLTDKEELKEVRFETPQPNLRYLDFGRCKIEKIVFSADCENLRAVYLQRNQLTHFEIKAKLPALELLDLSFNENLTELKIGADLPNLNYLYLHQCDMRDLSALSGYFVKEGFDFNIGENDNIEMPPKKYVDEGKQSVINYFNEIRTKETLPNNEVKMILVGNSTSGKTSLSKYLRTGEYDKNQPTTHGADLMNSWKPDKSNFKVNIWDFGGQEYYHSTYNLFMGELAVYVIVWENATNRGGFSPIKVNYENVGLVKENLEHFHYSYWLSNIRYQSQASPILMVCNKCDLHPKDFKRVKDFEISRYKLGPDYFEYNISIERSFEDKKNNIKNSIWVKRFELFRDQLVELLKKTANDFPLPKYYLDVKNRLVDMFDEESYEIDYDDVFKPICFEYDESPNFDNLMIYLRDISGIVLHYKKNPALQKKVFLNPNKINSLIYKVLNHDIKKKEGKFDFDHVVNVFKGNTQLADTFIELMKELGLIFEDSTCLKNYIAPQYLPQRYSNEKELNRTIYQAGHQFAFQLKFPNFLPRNVITRYIAKNGFTATQDYYWKYGMMHQNKYLSVLITCEPAGISTITVKIQSPGTAKFELEKILVFNELFELLDKKTNFEISIDGEEFIAHDRIIERFNEEARFITNRRSGRKHETRLFEFVANSSEKIRELMHVIERSEPLKIFVSYSKADIAAVHKLKKYLKQIQSFDIIMWYDENLQPASKVDDSIMDQIRECDVFVCIVTNDFLSTDYIWQKEIPLASKLKKKILPVIYDDCDWLNDDYKVLSKESALPNKGNFILDKDCWNTEGSAWRAVIEGFRKLGENKN